MPKRKVYGPERPPAKKKARVNKRSPTMLGNPNAPARMPMYRAKMIYASPLELNTTITGFAVQVFTVNGLYDVDITGVGHQPAGFDQMMALYNEYVVTHAWIKAAMTCPVETTGLIFGITLADFATTYTDPARYIENGSTTWTKLGKYESKTLTMRTDIAKFSSQDIMSEDSFSGQAGSNPTDTHYYHVWIYADGAQDTGANYGNVEIDFHTIFRDPALAPLS